MSEKQKKQNAVTSEQITELPLTNGQLTRGILNFMKDKELPKPTVREPVAITLDGVFDTKGNPCVIKPVLLSFD